MGLRIAILGRPFARRLRELLCMVVQQVLVSGGIDLPPTLGEILPEMDDSYLVE